MKKNSPNTDSRQMSFLSDTAPQTKRPPLRAADYYAFDLQYYTDDSGKHYYSVQDWVMAVAKADKPQQAKSIFQKIKKRADSVLTGLSQFPYLARDGKEYLMDFADEQTLYSITQHMRANSGIRDAVLEFLSKSGVAMGDIEQAVAKADKLSLSPKDQALLTAKINQGYSEDDAKTFLQLVKEGIPTRKDLMAILKLVVRGTINYGQATNVQYTALFNMTAKQIREITGFKTARDGMTPAGRATVTAAEMALEMALSRHKELSFDQALKLTQEVCAAYGASVKNLETMLGISLATGHPLLGGGQ